MEPVNSWSQKDEMAQRILNEAACGYSKQRLADLNYGSSTDYWSVADSVNSIFESKTPKVWLIVICLISFAALCPISYPILKGMDKREYIWYVIPGLAVFFCIIIFATSTNLRIRHPQEASLTLLYDKTELGSGISQEVSVGILVPSAKKESVDFTNTLSNIRTVNYNYYYSYSNGDQETTDYTKMIRETAEGYQVAIQNNETFDTSYFTFNANNDLEGMEGIETSWVRTTYGMSGTVTNHTGYDLSAVIVFCDSKCVEIGDLADGETAAFTESDVQAYYSFYMLSDFFQSSKQYHKASQIKSIYERVYDSIVASGSSQSSNAVSQAYVVGYIDDWDVNYVGDSKVREFNAAVYVKGAPIPYEGYEDAVSFSVNDYAYDNYDWDSSDGQMYELEVELPVYFD
jgi:hypothetical protein